MEDQAIAPELVDRLVAAAHRARTHAYAPYSGFSVGAAVLAESGGIYTGCNVENAVYGATLCAERVAVGRAVAEGERRLVAIAVVASDAHADRPTTPCGTCRQVLAEFADDMPVIVEHRGQRWQFWLRHLLPEAFSARQLPNPSRGPIHEAIPGGGAPAGMGEGRAE